jgi:hypothetical protein
MVYCLHQENPGKNFIVRQGFLVNILCNFQGMKFFQDFPDEVSTGRYKNLMM